MKSFAGVVGLGLAIVFISCSPPISETPTADVPPNAEEQAVLSLLAAFNSHDPQAMAVLVKEDVQWLSISDSEVLIEATGREALVTSMVDYFAALPSAQSRLLSIESLGPWVTAQEEASWDVDGERRSQASVAVYEIRDGLVQRVWYYPAVR